MTIEEEERRTSVEYELQRLLPEHMQLSMRMWIDAGEPHPTRMGAFFRAALTNKLVEAFRYADPANTFKMWAWATFLGTYAPENCWGNETKLLAWWELHHPRQEWSTKEPPR